MSAGRTVNAKSQTWGTPLKYVKAVKKFFGGTIALDPCSNIYSIVQAETEFLLPDTDGLKEQWNYPSVYVNPPYGADRSRGTTIRHWLAKCAQSHKDFGAEVLALVPVAPNTKHWKQSVFSKARAVCFLYDTRLKFLENGLSTGKGAPMACAMVYWGKKYAAFFDVFIAYGAVVDLAPLQGKQIGETRNVLKLAL